MLWRRRTLPIFPPHSQSSPLPPKDRNALAKEDTPNLPPSLPIFPPPSQGSQCFGEGGHSQSSPLTPNLPPSLPSQAMLWRRRTLPILPPHSQSSPSLPSQAML